MYRKYDSKVPGFLHNRPNGIVRHIMKRMYPEYPSSYVQNFGHKLFMVKSETSDTRYQVWLGSDIQLPSCQCVDYRINRLPCKQGWIYWGSVGGGCTPPPSPGQVGCRGGGCYFHEKAEKYERHNEIHVIVMICHTVSEYHV